MSGVAKTFWATLIQGRTFSFSTLFDGHYLRNHSTLDIGVLGYIGIVQHKEHSPEVLSIPPGTPCVFIICVFTSIGTPCD